MLLSGCGAFRMVILTMWMPLAVVTRTTDFHTFACVESLSKGQFDNVPTIGPHPFPCGCRWTGQLRPQGSQGRRVLRLPSTSMVEAELPVISQEDMSGVVVLLHNQDF